MRTAAAAAAAAVRAALAWLGEHFSHADALEGLPERVGLSANHFRLLFRRHVSVSPRGNLSALSMRAEERRPAKAGLAWADECCPVRAGNDTSGSVTPRERY